MPTFNTDTPATLADTDLASIYPAWLAETTRRQTVATAQQTAAEVAKAYADATASTDAKPTAWAAVPDILPPGVRVTFTDGKVYRNISATWLPKTAGPGAYPLGWAVEGAPTTAWKAATAYKVGAQVTYQGKTYQCAQVHTSQAGWEPSAVPALWSAL